MKERIVQISQTAIKGRRIGAVFKNRGAFNNRVIMRPKENEDVMKKPCLTEATEVVQEEKKQETNPQNPNSNPMSLN